jgi:protein-tyrosine phosphatase
MKILVGILGLILGIAGMSYAQPSATQKRQIVLDGSLNTRDIGGYRTSDGREVVWGKLFRSSELSYLTDADIRVLESKHIATVVDFRGPKEAEDAPDRLPPGTLKVSSPVIGDQLDEDAVHRFLKRDGFPAGMYDEAKVASYGPFYRMLTLVNSYDDPGFVDKLVGYKPFFSQLVKQTPDKAILFHCTGGRDRTGVATALLLYLLGVPEKTIEADYVASNTYLQPDREDPDSVAFQKFRFSNVFIQPVTNHKLQQVAASFGTTPEKINASIALKPEYLRDLFGNIEKRYGSIENFMKIRMDIGPAQIAELRAKYTVPAQISSQPVP